MCEEILIVLDGKDAFAGSLNLKSLQQRVRAYNYRCLYVDGLLVMPFCKLTGGH
jgi:hypothetical protein